MKQTEDEILAEAHDYSDALDRRGERREIYQMVAGAILSSSIDKAIQYQPEFIPLVGEFAEAIYQGMLKFVGDKT